MLTTPTSGKAFAMGIANVERTTTHTPSSPPGERAQTERRRGLADGTRLTAERGLVLVVILASWWLLVRWEVLDPIIFSTPSAVGAYLLEAFTTVDLWGDVAYTTLTTFSAFIVSGVLGVVTGLLFVQSPRLRRICDPFLVVANSLPRVALAPLLIAWLGIGFSSKFVLGVSVAYFVVLVNTMAGADSIDEDWVKLSRSLGASRRTIFLNVTLPASVPSIFAGLKLGIVYSMLAVVVGEMMGGSRGIGQQISFNSNTFQMDKVLGQLLILAVITAAMSALVGLLERRLMRWRSY